LADNNSAETSALLARRRGGDATMAWKLRLTNDLLRKEASRELMIPEKKP
jgi:hypothetical protein